MISRKVVFEVRNVNGTGVACLPDSDSYRLRGRMVGPRAEVNSADADRINALVHDGTTGSWFWNLRRHPTYDYATQLARRGETSVVLDRLGYGRSPLADGNATCLGAQADMLHQVVQHLRSGKYRFPGHDRSAPHAQRVVVHGHALGASIAQVEAGTYDDVDGLVLMSWSDSGPSQLALDAASRQSARCLEGADYAPLLTSARSFRRALFATAPRAVQASSAGLRAPGPCGDVQSYSANQVASGLAAAEVEAPVLLLFGARDALSGEGAAERQADAYPTSVSVTTHVVRRAGSALPAREVSAPDAEPRRRLARRPSAEVRRRPRAGPSGRSRRRGAPGRRTPRCPRGRRGSG